MRSQTDLIRAISAEFLRRKLRSVSLIGGLAAVVIIAVMSWLVSKSTWWLLLAIPVLSACLALAALLIGALFVIRVLKPELTATQSTAVTSFVDKLERVEENVQTPLFFIIFKVVRDMVWPRGTTFVQTVATDSTTLHTDYRDLSSSFPKK